MMRQLSHLHVYDQESPPGLEDCLQPVLLPAHQLQGVQQGGHLQAHKEHTGQIVILIREHRKIIKTRINLAHTYFK